MYDPSRSYDENHAEGPFPEWCFPHKVFPKLRFLEEPSFSFLGQRVHLPFGVPAGPLLNARFVQVAWAAGVSVCTYKTVRSRRYESHPHPNVTLVSSREGNRLPLHAAATPPSVVACPLTAEQVSGERPAPISISNSFGVPSQEPVKWSGDVKSLLPSQRGRCLVLSFQGTRGAQFEELVEDAKQVQQQATTALTQGGADAKADPVILEVNLSCPNEAGEPLYRNLKQCVSLLKALAAERDPEVRLIAKVGSLPSDGCDAFLAEAGEFVDAISSINTVFSEIRAESGKIVLGSGSAFGGVCGHAIFEENMCMLSRWTAARERLRLSADQLACISVGGVDSVSRFHRALEGGADHVQAATACMWNLSLPAQIAESLSVPFEVTHG